MPFPTPGPPSRMSRQARGASSATGELFEEGPDGHSAGPVFFCVFICSLAADLLLLCVAAKGKAQDLVRSMDQEVSHFNLFSTRYSLQPKLERARAR